MPEVQEVFRMATQKVRPEPGALERQFQGQRRRSTRRKAGALGLAAALAITALVVAVQASRETGRGGTTLPAEEGTRRQITVSGVGHGFSPDGGQLYASEDHQAIIYDAETGKVIRTVEAERGEEAVSPPGFSPDGELFVASSCDLCANPVGRQQTSVYDTATGEKLWDFPYASGLAAFSPDGSLLALHYEGGTRVFDLETGQLVSEFDWGGFAFSPDGRQLMVSWNSGKDGIVAHVYDVRGDRSPVLTLRGHGMNGAFGTSVAWSPDGSTLAAITGYGDAILWDADTGEKRFTISPRSGEFTSLAFSSASTLLATGSSDGTATVWELSSGDAAPILSRVIPDMVTWLYVAISSDGTRLMATSDKNETTIWRLPL